MNRRDVLKAASSLALATTGYGARAATPVSTPTLPQVLATRPIPATGERLPVIGLGTWQTFDVGAESTERMALVAVLHEFAALGGRVIDSSPMYGRAEDVAGALMQELALREKLFVATKVWTRGTQAGIAQMQSSIEKLATPKGKPFDLMQVHNLVDADAHLETLSTWKQDKRLRYIGITHYTESAYAEVAALI